jgi:two-component system NtrC family response regulator
VTIAARSDVNVLLVGESGTGKELAARAIHHASRRSEGPFVAHNCALTPSDAFAGDFFGHVTGAFPGAHRPRAGLLRDAHGGFLFLDGLESLSVANQAMLLRVMDDGEIRPLGSERAVPVSVRFVAATNRVPHEMLASGELREDLYYRLRGLEIRLPALRERLEDIPPLGEYLLRPSGKHLAPAAIEALRQCAWPDNVRQLRTVLQYAAARAAGNTIEAEDLDLQIPGGLVSKGSASPPVDWPLRTSAPGEVPPDPVKPEAILRALMIHSGNRSRAARALGIHRSTLARRLRELGLDRLEKERGGKNRSK